MNNRNTNNNESLLALLIVCMALIIRFNIVIVIIGLLMVFIFSGYADNVTLEQAIHMEQLGFWSGLCHGFILPFTLIVSWFSDSITIYAINNNGGFYNTGFFVGVLYILKSLR